MRRVAAYLRVSTKSQDHALQRDAIVLAARARGDRIGAWYSEHVSGAARVRPELERLRRDVRAGLVRRVYVWRLDRLSRGGIRDTLAIVEELRAHGAELATVADGFSIDGPGADVVLAVLAWAAQMERAAIGERIAAARARVEAAGGHWGRPRAVGPIVAAQIRERIAAGDSQRAIAAELGIPRRTVGRVAAQNGAYAERPDRPRKR